MARPEGTANAGCLPMSGPAGKIEMMGDVDVLGETVSVYRCPGGNFHNRKRVEYYVDVDAEPPTIYVDGLAGPMAFARAVADAAESIAARDRLAKPLEMIEITVPDDDSADA